MNNKLLLLLIAVIGMFSLAMTVEVTVERCGSNGCGTELFISDGGEFADDDTTQTVMVWKDRELQAKLGSDDLPETFCSDNSCAGGVSPGGSEGEEETSGGSEGEEEGSEGEEEGAEGEEEGSEGEEEGSEGEEEGSELFSCNMSQR